MNQVYTFFRTLFKSDGFPPRWHCGKWTEFHGWFYIVSDMLIWSAYFAIPLIIFQYINKKHSIRFLRLYLLFAAFIFACGFTHLIDNIIFWYPVYRLSALVKFITGVLSWVTVFYLIKYLPMAFSLKTNNQLEEEIALRKNAEEQLIENNRQLQDAREELKASLEKERSLSETKSRFVSFASHEFRTPLTHILSSAELIKMYPDEHHQDKRLKHIERISAAVGNLTDILNDFLSVEQLESGAIDKRISEFNLPVFFDDIIAEMNAMLNKKNQTIKYVHEGGAMVTQSEKMLRNILLNLCSNASKYSLADKEIYLTSSVNDTGVIITIKDNGIGIPEEDQHKLFTGYFRAGNVGHIQGTGLGLSIVKRYLELLGGNISFVSNVKEGTVFTVQFPHAAGNNNMHEPG